MKLERYNSAGMSVAATRVVLARHGEVISAWHGRIYGSLDVPLSNEGRAQSLRTAQAIARMTPSVVVSSGLQRTEDTAARVRELLGLPRRDDPDLRELERGAWAGLTQAELEAREPGEWGRWFRSPGCLRPPGGESLGDLFERVQPRVACWAGGHPGQTVALVTHGWVIRVLVCHALGADFDLAPRLDVRTGDLVILRWPSLVLEGFADDLRSLQLSE